MTIKARVYSTFYPLFIVILKKVLKEIKPLFLNEDERLKVVLSLFSFHPALITHPSILYGFRARNKTRSRFLNLKIAYLSKCIRVGLLKKELGHRLIQELNIDKCFSNGNEFWFEEAHSSLVPYQVPDNNKTNGKTVVYTALTGSYDDVHEILYKEDGIDYILFTNNPSLDSKTWKVVLIQSDLDNVLLSREVKMLPHKYLGDEYETSIYIDANAVIYGEITELTRYLVENKSLAVSRHSIRTSVLEEIEACEKLKGVDREEAEMQYKEYIRNGFKDNIPLMECGILVRRHKDKQLQELMQAWFYEFKNGIKRDQLSLNPCIDKLAFKDYVIMNGSVWHNQFNKIQSHK